MIEQHAVGGQAGTTSLIRNYSGFPAGVSGARLATTMFQQAWGLGASFFVIRSVVTLEQSDSGELTVQLSDGTTVHTGSVVLATGVSYRRLLAPGVDELVGRGVFYSPAVTEAAAMTNQPVVVVGGGNSAGQAAMHLSKSASTVTILVRSSSLAASRSDYLIRELQAATNIAIRYQGEVGEAIGDEHLERITVRDTTAGVPELLESAGLFVLIGSQHHTEWLPPSVKRDEWGFILTGREAGADPAATTASSLPGVFAAGDVRRVNQTSRLRRRRGRDRHQPRPPIPRESRPQIARSLSKSPIAQLSTAPATTFAQRTGSPINRCERRVVCNVRR